MAEQRRMVKCINPDCSKSGATHIKKNHFKNRAHRDCESAPCDCDRCGPIKIKAPPLTNAQKCKNWK